MSDRKVAGKRGLPAAAEKRAAGSGPGRLLQKAAGRRKALVKEPRDLDDPFGDAGEDSLPDESRKDGAAHNREIWDTHRILCLQRLDRLYRQIPEIERSIQEVAEALRIAQVDNRVYDIRWWYGSFATDGRRLREPVLVRLVRKKDGGGFSYLRVQRLHFPKGSSEVVQKAAGKKKGARGEGRADAAKQGGDQEDRRRLNGICDDQVEELLRRFMRLRQLLGSRKLALRSISTRESMGSSVASVELGFHGSDMDRIQRAIASRLIQAGVEVDDRVRSWLNATS